MCDFGLLVDASSHGEAAFKVSHQIRTRFHPFEVTLNGQQYTVDGLVWAFTSTPRISTIWPVMGERSSNLVVTIRGSGFSSACDARCNFTEVQVVQASYDVTSGNLWCQPPPGTHLLSTTVEVSLNAAVHGRQQGIYVLRQAHNQHSQPEAVPRLPRPLHRAR